MLYFKEDGGENVEDFNTEIEEGYLRIKERKIEELSVAKNELQRSKNQIGDLIAEKNLYLHRMNVKGHNGWEAKIKELDNRGKRQREKYDERNTELSVKITTLEFDIQSLDEILNLKSSE